MDLRRKGYESEKTAGLSATSSEVSFDLRSMWAQSSILGGIRGLIGSAPKGVAGAVTVPQPLPDPSFNTEVYDSISDNPFISVAVDPRATFSIDVDTASYANMRRFVTRGEWPPKDSVRIEEMINYFTYDYPPATGPHPIDAFTEVASAPWKPDHRLVRIGVKARDIDMSKRPPSNLVFLIDVSGSMSDPEKLPLLKSALKLLIDNLNGNDRVAMVVYAGASGLVLPSTTGDRKSVMLAAVDSLESGGSTNGAEGIQLAYQTAVSSFIRNGINRIVLATDGDFNVGVTNEGALVRLIEEKAKSGVFLSVLGFGMGNLKDSTLERLADKGNGNYAYIDTLNEARKVLVEEMGSTLVTVAKDVKIQVEFNPAEVRAYRLIGYENRVMRHEDFNDDRKDAGDMGAGHAVTALFEVVPAGVAISLPGVDALRYQPVAAPDRNVRGGELLNLKIRYKEPEGNTSELLEFPVIDRNARFQSATDDFRFAAAVASFGMILRDSPHKAQFTFDEVVAISETSRGADKNGYRNEFVSLLRKAQALKARQ
jgi:Ca-activated chloride channel family protein